jgi:hypothetical protein
MSANNDEQRELQHELATHSDRFLQKNAELDALERADREQPIGTPQFERRAAETLKAADELRKIADAQRAIGEEADSADVSINDVSANRGK